MLKSQRGEGEGGEVHPPQSASDAGGSGCSEVWAGLAASSLEGGGFQLKTRALWLEQRRKVTFCEQ